MIVITGSSGLIGSHLVFKASRKFDKIKALYNNENKVPAIKEYLNKLDGGTNDLETKIEWIQADVRDYESLVEHFRQAEAVFHTAAVVSFRKADRKWMKEINVEGTKNVVNACLEAKVPYLGHVSSVAALQHVSEEGKITEDFSGALNNYNLYYGKTKAEAEREVFRGIAEGLQATVINPTVILGYSPFNQSSAALFYAVKKGMPFYSPGSTDFVSVWDVAEILLQLYDKRNNNQRFIVSAEHWSYKDLLSEIARQLNKKPPKIKLPYSLALSAAFLSEKLAPKSAQLNVESIRSAYEHVFFDNSKIKTTLNYQFKEISDIITEVATRIEKG